MMPSTDHWSSLVFLEKIDESMVSYKGHHGAKMFIRGKPIRFGYKDWMLCSSDGFPFQASIFVVSQVDQKVGVWESMWCWALLIKFLTKGITLSTLITSFLHTAWCASSKKLECVLLATGTVREGRVGTAVLPHRRDFYKSHRSKYVHVCDGTVNIVMWNTTMLSLAFQIWTTSTR